MIFDTDIIIWFEMNNKKAIKQLDEAEERFISVLTKMELFQGGKNKHYIKQVEQFISEYNFTVLPLTNDIGHRALIYIEEYGLSDGVMAIDAIIAATAVENNLSLCSGNIKHFKPIKELKLIPFHP